MARSGVGEDFAGGEVGDGDVVVVGEREDAFAGVRGADAEVVDAAGAADGHAACGVEAVVSEAVVAGGVPVGGREGFGGGAVGVAWSSSLQRAVGALLVVVRTERVELVLELSQGACEWSGAEPALEGLVEALGLALRLGWPGDPFFWWIPSNGRRYSKALRPPVNRDV